MRWILVLMVALAARALDCPDHENPSRMAQLHRERLRAHWRRMRELAAGEASGIHPPAIWWWNQPEAWGFYRGLLGPREGTQRRMHRPGYRDDRYRYVLEDTHLGGRVLANAEARMHQEIFLSRKHRIAYVVVKKSASNAIFRHMEEHLEADLNEWCRAGNSTFLCPKTIDNQVCTSQCLDPSTHLTGDYLFFSFVMHPVRRFFKAAVQVSTDLFGLMSESLWMDVLGDMQDHGWAPDTHFETQSFSLSPFLHRPDSWKAAPDLPQLQMDFIGRVETLDEDWAAFVELANDSRHERGAEEIVGAGVGPVKSYRHSEILGEEDKRRVWDWTMSTRVQCLAHEVFAQDIVSFGYGMLDGYDAVESEMGPPAERASSWP